MENPLKVLKNSAVVAKLVKTPEGQNLLTRLLDLIDDVDVLQDVQRRRFNNEFGNKIEDSLSRLAASPNEVLPEAQSWTHHFYIIATLVVFAGKHKISCVNLIL